MIQRRLLELSFSTAVAIIAWPLVAYAGGTSPSGNDLGTLLSNASSETVYGPGFILSVTSFVIGAASVMWGLIKLKEAADGQTPVKDGVWRILGGSFLVALPFIVNATLNTLYPSGYENGTEGNYSSGLAGYNDTCGNTGSLDGCMIAFMKNIYEPAQGLINAATYILGGICVAVGVYRLAQSGNAARGAAPGASGTIGYIAGGGGLISLGEFMNFKRGSIFGGLTGNGTFSQLAFSTTNPLPSALTSDANGVFMALFAWVQLIGWLAFARGIYLLIKISQGTAQRSHGHAFTHIVCGAMAVNMFAIITAIQGTLGFNLVSP